METDYDTKGPGNAFKLRKYTAAGFLQIPGCLLWYGVDFCLYASMLDVKRCAEGVAVEL